jgi:YHS domain-containing protein
LLFTPFAYNSLLRWHQPAHWIGDHQFKEGIMLTPKIYRKFDLIVLLSIGFLFLVNNAIFAGIVQSSKVYGVAIDGYDPVAYFTENRPVKGSSEFSYTWNEARWYFSKPEHRELFAANPEKFTPKRAGF